MPTTYLDFEKPIAELETKIAELESLAQTGDGPSISDELKKLKDKAAKQLKDTYSSLTPWRKTQVARHPERPHMSDYVEYLLDDFQELAGDRVFGNDEAVIGGLATFRGRSVVVMGHEKGRTTESRLRHNFGMAHPEGYRKAVRLMDLAEKFNLPVLTFVDTAGAFPGKAGEERGQAEAIARSTERCLTLTVPMVALIIGEGGSGG
ncbi:MAG: carboxyl transferase domain-containing protein, partial [Henriciella sp.]